MRKPVVYCLAAGLLALAVAGCGRYVGTAAFSDNGRRPVQSHAPVADPDRQWIEGLLSAKDLPGAFPAVPAYGPIEPPSVGAYFEDIGRRNAERYTEWREFLHENAAEEIVPDVAPPHRRAPLSVPAAMASVDSESGDILQKYAGDRLNCLIRVNLLEARLTDAQDWERADIKRQLESANAKLKTVDSACDEALAVHAAAEKKNQAETFQSETDVPAASVPVKRTACLSDALPASSPGVVDGGWVPISSPADVTQSREFKDRLSDTRKKVDEAIQVLRASISSK